MNIHVGNFDNTVLEEELIELFALHGQVDSLQIRKDIYTGISKGFGYVSMPNETEALQAILKLHNYKFNNRLLTVGKAKFMSANRRMV